MCKNKDDAIEVYSVIVVYPMWFTVVRVALDLGFISALIRSLGVEGRTPSFNSNYSISASIKTRRGRSAPAM